MAGVGVGVSTVFTIVIEVSVSIINNLWKDSVKAHFPSDEAHFKEKCWTLNSCGNFLVHGPLLMVVTYR